MNQKPTEAGNANPGLTPNAIHVLERRYLLRDNHGKLTETPAQLFRRVAKTMAAVEKKRGASPRQALVLENRFYSMMASLDFLPNTPCLMNAGARLHQLSACFVVDIQDNLSSIFYALSATAKIHQTGGGTGFSFSNLRPKGDRVASTGGKASGPLSFMRIFDSLTDTMKQGGMRRGANMGILRVDHPDIVDFIRMKEYPNSMRNFNLSVSVTDAFMEAERSKKEYLLLHPHSQKPAQKINAREVFDLITAHAWKTGDPGLIFADEINRRNPTKHLGPIEATNPCGEVPLHPWESCNLGSLNLAHFVSGPITRAIPDWKKLKQAVRDAVRFLDNMIDASEYPLEEIREKTLANRRIGLGVMGFAEALIWMGIPYGSKAALAMGNKLMKYIEKESVAMSRELGKARGSFPNFKGSAWHKRGYTAMRNATTTAIAPTGTLSIIAGCSSGVEPLFAVSFVRTIMEGTVSSGRPEFNTSEEAMSTPTLRTATPDDFQPLVDHIDLVFAGG
ncbi:adenosylcobalamin-dependent ribonucleoside-diphosphate reductase, partial [Candidatus Peregrinibacteria bacterium]|nr:adenosylcobalamin-dependent ribonucleoside-diphosphate reductase [Candidatus Peregrinibacteria bacterium]